jgi:hypothetical protein
MPSTGLKENQWVVNCVEQLFFQPSIRRLYNQLKRDFSPEYFEIVPLEELKFELVRWSEAGCWFLDSFLMPTLKKEAHSFVFRLRGVKVSMSAVHLCGYFEDVNEASRFHKLVATLEKGFQEYGLSYQKNIFLSIPIVRLKHTGSLQKVPSLEHWQECEFGEVRMLEWRIKKEDETFYTVPLNRFICHRGNLQQKFVPDENKPDLLEQRIREGYSVELDVWYQKEKYWLGHDEPQYEVEFEWLMKNLESKYIHCKNGETFAHLLSKCGRLGYNANVFYHTNEDYALTSRGHIIVLPGKSLLHGSVNMMPEMAAIRRPLSEWNKTFAFCSDSVSQGKAGKASIPGVKEE